jgi:hypothetical protein
MAKTFSHSKLRRWLGNFTDGVSTNLKTAPWPPRYLGS